MPWDGVPWFIGGDDAEHSAETARLLAYGAFGGKQGLMSATDCRVRELNVPGPQVRVTPGACAILSQELGGQYQSYVARLPEEDVVDVSQTTSTGPRSDLVVVQIADPNVSGSGWQQPLDPVRGPYVWTDVIEGVPADTTDVAQLNLGLTALTLCRIDIPVSTATITQAMIKDGREMSQPRTGVFQATATVATDESLTSSVLVQWPTAAQWQVPIPAYATRAKVRMSATGVVLSTGLFFGQINAELGSIVLREFPMNGLWPGASVTTTWDFTEEIDIPPEMRGTTQTLRNRARRTVGPGVFTVDDGTTLTARIDFSETPSQS